jgi:hypothetical protein
MDHQLAVRQRARTLRQCGTRAGHSGLGRVMSPRLLVLFNYGMFQLITETMNEGRSLRKH